MVKLPDGAQFVYDERMLEHIDPDIHATRHPLYTTPPQRKPLTEEEILTYRHVLDWTAEWSYINFARAIEAAHGIGGEV